eukprot:365091-Chlamydomonas_euryale.AAC.21
MVRLRMRAGGHFCGAVQSTWRQHPSAHRHWTHLESCPGDLTPAGKHHNPSCTQLLRPPWGFDAGRQARQSASTAIRPASTAIRPVHSYFAPPWGFDAGRQAPQSVLYTATTPPPRGDLTPAGKHGNPSCKHRNPSGTQLLRSP